jgi:TonB family protein
MTIVSRVRLSSALLTFLIYVTSIPARGQTIDVQNHLSSTYKGKHFLLRNFYVGNDLEYDQDGILRSGKAIQGPWTLAGIEIAGVAITTQGLEIVGDRLGVLYRDEHPRFVKIGRFKIRVARPVTSKDTDAALDPILAKIFIKTEEEDLRSLVPEYWRYYLAGTDSKSRSAAWQASIEESKVRTFNGPGASADKLAPPRVLNSPDPKYTNEAVSHHIEGVSNLGVVVDAKGAPVKIAILQPLGMGLDEQAVLAVAKWKFRPPTSNGEPVQAQINIEITFRCCP